MTSEKLIIELQNILKEEKISLEVNEVADLANTLVSFFELLIEVEVSAVEKKEAKMTNGHLRFFFKKRRTSSQSVRETLT